MNDYDARDWLRILFRVRGSVLPRLIGRALLAAVVGVLAVAADRWLEFHLAATAHGLIGVALGLLLVFRTNTSYDRFWEGRKLVGRLVTVARDLVRQAVVYGKDAARDGAEVRRLVLAFYYLWSQRLRGEDDLAALERFLTPGERTALTDNQHRAPVVVIWLNARLTSLVHDDDRQVSELRMNRVDANMSALLEVLGGCERIRSTPIPFAYAHHIKLFLALFCFTAPFAMAHGMLWWTPVAAAALALALFGIDEIGVEIEQPFGDDDNDIPLGAIGRALERATEEMAASPTLQPMEPHAGTTPVASAPRADALEAAGR